MTKEKMYYMHCLIGLIIMFGFGFLPAPAPITTLGMQMLGVFWIIVSLVDLWFDLA